jgi:hypothetical protein
MKRTCTLAALALVGSLTMAGCGGGTTKPGSGMANTQGSNSSGPPPTIPKGAPLPDRAFKAGISAVNPPETMSAGQQATIQVKLKNNSDVTWTFAGDSDGKYQIKLGNHWLYQNSKPVVIDDGRTPITADLKPGAEIELPLIVTAPTKPGSYILQIDVVQENVAWSGDKGNTTFKVKVQVK